MNLSTERDIAVEIAHRAGEMLASHTPREVISSIGKDIKISTDREAHRMIKEFIEARSKIPVLSEEDEEAQDFTQVTMWVVDPLDGSVNYFRNLPISSVSIGLIKDGKPVLGVVYDFNRDEMFVGLLGEGATLNGQPISVSSTDEKAKAVMMTGFPSHTNYDDKALRDYIASVQMYKKIRNIGSAALSLAYVACGRADAYFEKDIKIWDVVAGLALVECAGGSYLKEETYPDGRYIVSATNGKL